LRVVADQTTAIAERPDESVGWTCGFDIVEDFLTEARYEHIKDGRAVRVGPDYRIEKVTAFEISQRAR
jgi:hypothetical protein